MGDDQLPSGFDRTSGASAPPRRAATVLSPGRGASEPERSSAAVGSPGDGGKRQISKRDLAIRSGLAAVVAVGLRTGIEFATSEPDPPQYVEIAGPSTNDLLTGMCAVDLAATGLQPAPCDQPHRYEVIGRSLLDIPLDARTSDIVAATICDGMLEEIGMEPPTDRVVVTYEIGEAPGSLCLLGAADGSLLTDSVWD